MRKLVIWGAVAVAILVMPVAVMAARGGVRGAAVGGMVAGEKGAKVGAAVGVTKEVIDREGKGRATYQATEEYKTAKHSDFNETPPEVIVEAKGAAKAPDGEAVIKKDGKPFLGISFPADWKQKTGDNYVAACSGDGTAYGVLVAMDGVKDKEAAMKKAKEGLDKYLDNVKYDEEEVTKGGATIITGTGKGKKSGVEVVFVAGVFEASKGQFAGAAFVVDSKIEDHYKEVISYTCQTIRRPSDFDKKE